MIHLLLLLTARRGRTARDRAIAEEEKKMMRDRRGWVAATYLLRQGVILGLQQLLHSDRRPSSSVQLARRVIVVVQQADRLHDHPQCGEVDFRSRERLP